MEQNKLSWHSYSNTEDNVNSSLKPQAKVSIGSRKKYIMTLTFALICTIFQVICFKSCQQNISFNGDKKFAFVVANKSLNKGDVLNEENTSLAYLDLSDAKDNYILNSEFKKYKNKEVRNKVLKNSPVSKLDVFNRQRDLSLTDKIPPGKRFYSLKIDLSSLGAILKVGDIVDVIAHMDIKGYGKATETILSRIKVVGIGNDFNDSTKNEEASQLSFYLSPEEVKIISFMKTYSDFSVVIRNPNDLEESKNDSITFNQFLQDEKIQKIFKNDTFKIIQGQKLRDKNL